MSANSQLPTFLNLAILLVYPLLCLVILFLFSLNTARFWSSTSLCYAEDPGFQALPGSFSPK